MLLHVGWCLLLCDIKVWPFFPSLAPPTKNDLHNRRQEQHRQYRLSVEIIKTSQRLFVWLMEEPVIVLRSVQNTVTDIRVKISGHFFLVCFFLSLF